MSLPIITILQLRDRLNEILNNEPDIESHPVYFEFPNELKNIEVVREDAGEEQMIWLELS